MGGMGSGGGGRSDLHAPAINGQAVGLKRGGGEGFLEAEGEAEGCREAGFQGAQLSLEAV